MRYCQGDVGLNSGWTDGMGCVDDGFNKHYFLEDAMSEEEDGGVGAGEILRLRAVGGALTSSGNKERGS